MLTKSGAKLLDFGLAKTGSPAAAANLERAAGTEDLSTLLEERT